MTAEESRETTFEPVNRTLVQETTEDAVATDDPFRILMGDTVEPHCEFIDNQAMEGVNWGV